MLITNYALCVAAFICFVLAALPITRVNLRWEWLGVAMAFAALKL